jgi:hypothetical protein
MLGKSKGIAQAARLDQFCAELLSAVTVSEDEVSATACSYDAYDRVRLRIAETVVRQRARRSAYHRLATVFVSLLGAPRFVVVSSTAAILLALALGLFALLSGPSSPDSAPSQPSMQATVQSAPYEIEPGREVSGGNAITASAQDKPVRAPRKRARSENRQPEVATDFLPLTYVDDLSAQQSGHIVRMKVSRSALIAFGVPMNMERAGELITADVMIGDDGLARAIRFVQ